MKFRFDAHQWLHSRKTKPHWDRQKENGWNSKRWTWQAPSSQPRPDAPSSSPKCIFNGVQCLWWHRVCSSFDGADHVIECTPETNEGGIFRCLFFFLLSRVIWYFFWCYEQFSLQKFRFSFQSLCWNLVNSRRIFSTSKPHRNLSRA